MHKLGTLQAGACSTAERRKDTWVTASPRRRIPEATVARLPLYYRALMETGERQVATISSERLAELAGVNAAKVRKDLSYLGSYGTRGVGYDVEYLLHEISRELGLTRDWPVAIVGIGNLGRALANYRGFGARGFRVEVLIDADPALVGHRIGDLAVVSIDDLDRVVREHNIAIGILATPAAAAQDVADRLVAAGVTSILNFAPAVCSVPDGVSMRKVDLAIELQILSFYQLRRGTTRRRASARTDGVSGRSPVAPGLAGYPVNLLVRGRRVVVVGAGRIAARKIEPLLDAGAVVEVVAPEAGAEVRAWADAGRLVLHERAFEAADLDGAWLALTATDDPAVNAAVHAAGEAAPGLGQQCRRSGQLLLYADVGDPARRPRRQRRHRRPEPGAGRAPAAPAGRGDRT